jgi:hypothetical protein
MNKFAFAALAAAIFWGSTATAWRQSPQEHLTRKEFSAAWSIAETVAAPDLSINVW